MSRELRELVTVPETEPLVLYTVGGAGETVFSFPFPYWDDTDVRVFTKLDSSGSWVERFDYTLSPVSGFAQTGYASGNVTFSPTVYDSQVLLLRDSVLNRLSNLPPGQALDLFALNRDLSRNVGMLQSQRLRLDRALRLPVTDAIADASDMELPADRANKLLGFDTGGLPVALPASYVLEATPLPIDTIAAMQALTAPQHGDAVLVTEAGRGGLFVYDVSRSAENDGGTVFDGWVRRYSGALNVLWFGTNTTPGTTDMTSAIQAAIDAAYAQGGGDVYIPAGTYGVTTISKVFYANRINVNIIGAGMNATILQKIAAGSTTTPIIDFVSGTIGAISPYSTIEKLTVSGLANAGTPLIHDGVRFTRLAYFDLRDVEIVNCDIGFDNVATQNFSFWNCVIGSNFTGYRSRTTQDGPPFFRANAVQFYGGRIGYNAVYGLDIGESSGHNLNGVILLYNGVEAQPETTGAIIWRSTVDDEWGASVHNLNNCWFEYPGGMMLRSEAAPKLHLTLRNCVLINPSPTQAEGNVGDFASMASLTLDHCVANGVTPPSTITSAALRTLIIGGWITNYVDNSTTTKINFGSAAEGISIIRGPAVRVDEVYADERAYIKEAAAAGAPISTWGQLWVANTTPQQLFFTDEAGTDKLITPVIDEIVTTTKVITAAESGKTFFLDELLGFTLTLPAPALGLKYTFIVSQYPSGGGNYIITTENGDNLLYGSCIDPVSGLTWFWAQDTINFVTGVAKASDRIEMVCDSEWWHVIARSGAAGGITVSVT